MNTPWKYIKLSEVMSSVKSDLYLYDDAGMIDNDKVIKIIAECNENLGQRIYKSRECKIKISDYKAPIPEDLYKIENMFATKMVNITSLNPSFGAKQVEFLYTKPEDTSKIITYGKMGCVDSCNNCYWVEDRRPDPTYSELVYETIIPLSITDRLQYRCEDYAPCNSYTGEYKVDLEEEEFTFSFKEGEVYICYLGDLISEDGEIEIPFHPKLNSYYEYAIKEKILEDYFLNSDADVVRKLQLVTEKKRSAYAVAWDYVQTEKVKEWNTVQKKLKNEYYNRWFRMFNN